VHTLSAAVGASILAHTAAIGALLMVKPVPHLSPTLEIIEISLVPGHELGSARANNVLGEVPAESSVGVSVPLSLVRPDVTATASSPNWSRSVNMGRSFDVPNLPTFGRQTQTHNFDTLATMLDCLAVGDSTRGASRRPRRAHPPCASDDPTLRAPAMTVLPTYAPRPSEIGADSDYLTFKASQSVFYESPLPDQVQQANRAFENWILGLFR